MTKTETPKYKVWPISPFLHKQVGGRHHFGFLQSASSLVCLSLGDIGKLQKLGKLQN